MKEKIINCIKLFLLIFMMTVGFFMTYSLVWHSFGSDLTNLEQLVLWLLACFSEFAYIMWVSE